MAQVDFVFVNCIKLYLVYNALWLCLLCRVISHLYNQCLQLFTKAPYLCASCKFFIDLALLNLLSKCTRLMCFTLYCAKVSFGAECL